MTPAKVFVIALLFIIAHAVIRARLRAYFDPRAVSARAKARADRELMRKSQGNARSSQP